MLFRYILVQIRVTLMTLGKGLSLSVMSVVLALYFVNSTLFSGAMIKEGARFDNRFLYCLFLILNETIKLSDVIILFLSGNWVSIKNIFENY